MGKKVHNAKARQNQKVIVDNSALKNVQVELDESNAGAGYDEANALVLPSKKRATKIKVENKQKVRILSKKQRKHLQTIVSRADKKSKRAGVLEALAAVQIPTEELKQYTSISQVQTVGNKKLSTLDELLPKNKQKHEQRSLAGHSKISSIKGAAKRRLLREEEKEIEAKRRNPNFVGCDDNDDDDDDDEDDDDEDDNDDDDDNDDGDNDKDVRNDEAKEDHQENKDKQNVITESENVDNQPKLPKNLPSVQNTSLANNAPAPSTATQPLHKTVFIPVHRKADVQVARLKLPILGEEQQVMETINENNIVIIAGETGSGKTTQVPQFLYEAGYAENNKLIGITEPRRVAAIAMSKRVAHEMNLSHREVSYLIRFEGNVTPQTRIKFMTDGVLLKEIESDFLLQKYSVIILDEAHERSAYTDILVGLLSRIVPLRLKRGNPLKLIIMSATLRVEDFTTNARLFKTPPPLLKVEARQFPVTIHFQKRTPTNYVDEALKKTARIHAKLPEGGILVFLTGQQEVRHLVRKLRHAFPYNPGEKSSDKKNINDRISDNTAEAAPLQAGETSSNIVDTEETSGGACEDEYDEFDIKRAIKHVRKSKKKFLSQLSLPKVNLDDYKLPGDDTEADLYDDEKFCDDENSADGGIEFDSNDEDEDDDDLDTLTNTFATNQPLWVLPLYSLLSTEQQNRIFQPPPEGCRLCIVSTNVAETSLTIPNIKYVVDSGRQKTRIYDKLTGVSAFVVTFTSKASAGQRAGRAGRVSAGHCYRLYSTAVFKDEFEDFSLPDIQKKPVDDLMLQMRCMGIDRVINFPFPSPPDILQLQAAEQRLITLGALERVKEIHAAKEVPPVVTKLGHIISRFPVAPRFGKMLALSHQQNLLPYTTCLVAALSVQEVLAEVNVDREKDDGTQLLAKWQRKRLNWTATGNYQLLGDPMVLLRAVGGAEYAGSQNKLEEFCATNGLRHKAIVEVRKLRVQLTNEINLSVNDVDICVDPSMPPPTDAQARFLRQILLAGMGDRVARKVPVSDINDKEERRRLKYAYNCLDMTEPAFIHSSSVLKQKLPEWVIFQEAYETRNGDTTKMFIRGITAIEPEWLLCYVPQSCNILDIKEDPLPRYKPQNGKMYCFVDATFGKAGWELPLAEVEMPLNDKACSYFGMFLLDGSVCSKLTQFKSKLRVTPSSLIKSWSNLNQNIVRFKRELTARQIHTRQKLYETWELNSNFLLQEYYSLLYDVSLTEVTAIWPPKDADSDL